MIRELSVVEPLAPEVGGALHAVVCLVVVDRRRMLGPGEGYERRIAAMQCRAGAGAAALEAQAQIGDQLQLEVDPLPLANGLVVVVAGVLPPAVARAVVEDRLTIEVELDNAVDALHGAQ